MKNVICMKWGDKYGPEYVNNLYNMVKRSLTLPHRFICFTDNTRGFERGIEVFPLPEINVPEKHRISPWQKLSLLGKELGNLAGETLFLDLDIVIVENINCFFEYPGKFCIIENWTQAGRGIGNSSVYRFEIGAHADILDYYNNNMDEVLRDYDNEQMFISLKIAGKIGSITFWPEEWCKSFKHSCLPKIPFRYFVEPKIPQGAKIIVFHGHPNPHDALVGKWPEQSWRKFVKPTRWIGQYWK